MKKISESILNNPSTKHILPFFWQHGEDHEILKEEIEAIQNCGLNEFCVESRVHEQFCEDKWWEDFGFILKEAKDRGMRVWLLDDKRFPTGYANNYIKDHPELRMTSLRYTFYDFVGPKSDVAIIPEKLAEDESFVSIVAYNRTENGHKLSGNGIQLSNKIENGLLWWDVPEGVWRVYYVIKTHKACAPTKENYIDMLSPESCKAMIHAVYRPHFEHFSEYFGNTFAGFFSDEPSFSNDRGSYYSKLGKEDMLIPWSDDLPELIAKRAGVLTDEIIDLLPSLWHEIKDKTPILRENYMETVTEKYSKNFCYMLGDWCRQHGVMYIGHIIEDMNTHQRLGYGAGHFFRSLDGQDMAGIDIVLNQMIPEHLDLDHTANIAGKLADPEFFNYALAKLASSHSHIQPLKQNRAMCEIYGAFGWAEGVPMMKYLTDHMLVNGINYFVPHAFSPKYPDRDCPPHFYARGTNSQYPLFAKLMDYTARMAHVLTDGIHRADVAVYYNAEAEWAGGEYMLEQKIAKLLTRNLIDFDFIPQDTLVEAKAVNGFLAVNEENYSALVVPYSQYLPERVINAFDRLSKEGITVIFADALPEKTSEMRSVSDKLQNCKVVAFDAIPSCIRRSVTAKTPCQYLRFYHVERQGAHHFMFWNENTFEAVDTLITLPVAGNAVIYDGWKNKLFSPQITDGKLRLKLQPSQALVVSVCETDERYPEFDYADGELQEISLNWQISIKQADAKEYVPFANGTLSNLAKELCNFAGTIKYETEFETADNVSVIDLGTVGESATLAVNGTDCGTLVSAPFRFDVRDIMKKGKNKLSVTVYSNLGYRERDSLSRYLTLPPTGLVGPITIEKY